MSAKSCGVRGELRAVVRNDHVRLAAPADQIGQFTRHPTTRDRCVRDRGQAFARHVVDDVQHPEAPPTGELVVHEVQGPACIRSRRDQDRRARAHRSSPRPALAHRQPFLPVEPIDAVDAGWLTLPPQQDEQPPIAEAPAIVGEVAQLAPQLRLRWTARPVADHLAIGTDE